ncbi:hypothetical protein HaLaN_10876, partial [Haematococcus lacustris]
MNSWSSSDPIILPDAMYLFVPLSLSMMGDDKQGCRIDRSLSRVQRHQIS